MRIVRIPAVCFVYIFTSLLVLGQTVSFSGPKLVSFEKGAKSFPTDSGQFWISYDISPYTKAYPNIKNPQRAILNWILLDTGPEFWFQPPFGSICIKSNRLEVYHTAEVQQYVSNVLDRFMDSEKRLQLFQIRIFLVQSPEWRTRTADWLQPYPVKSKLCQGWLLARESRDLFVSELSKRSDFIELNTARNQIPHGETFGWVLAGEPKNFVRDIRSAAGTPLGYVADMSNVDEGSRLEVTPLLSTDNTLIEFAFKYQTTVVEKMLSYHLKVPTSNTPKQQLSAELPQILHAERSDKISFPKDNVFLLDLGLLPMILPEGQNQKGFIPGLFSGKSCYYQILLMIEGKGTKVAVPSSSESPTGQFPARL